MHFPVSWISKSVILQRCASSSQSAQNAELVGNQPTILTLEGIIEIRENILCVHEFRYVGSCLMALAYVGYGQRAPIHVPSRFWCRLSPLTFPQRDKHISCIKLGTFCS